ncbi:MAG TPA: transposase [Candidatus Paceibacterota bacterium]|nr:transposase [Candidatus Paceibacterota bacterium]
MSEIRTRKNYDQEFKESAVKLVMTTGRSVEQVASDLGISSNTLFIWKKKYLDEGKDAFPGKGNMKPEDAERRMLEKELARTKRELEILKKALAFFARAEP